MKSFEVGQTVYRAYVAVDPKTYWIDDGVVSSFETEGQQFVKCGTMLVVLDERWHATKTEAKGDVVKALVRRIGELQARIGEIQDELVHELIVSG
jgi:hypothetical protein